MSNLTVSVDEHLIKLARMRAIEQGTSLSAKVREFLQAYVGGSAQALAQQRAESTARLLAAMDAAAAVSGPTVAAAPAARGQRRSLRDQIYEDDFRARDRAAAATRAKGVGAGTGAKPRATRAR
jgi:plasmid stability protein